MSRAGVRLRLIAALHAAPGSTEGLSLHTVDGEDR